MSQRSVVWQSQIMALRTVVRIEISVSYSLAVTAVWSPNEIKTEDNMK